MIPARAMTMRRGLIAGNWKMNGLRAEAAALATALVYHMKERDHAPGPAEVLICPPATLLVTVSGLIDGSGLLLGGQDCNPHSAGAHTGEISAAMLRDAGCSHVILGHSERRADQHEDNALIRDKAAAAITAGLTVILCVGETLDERESGHAESVVARQLAESLPHSATAENLVVAYEPVWAIGTGRSAQPADVAGMHARLRAMLVQDMTDGAQVRLLYGGSVKAGNAAELLRIEDVDGALVGGASLDAAEFWQIVQAAG